MDFVFWIIAIVLIVGVVWWLLNRSNSANAGGSAPARSDGALSGGSAAASAEAAGTAGLPSAAGFGSAAEPAPPTTADEESERSVTALEQDSGAGQEPVVEPVAAGAPATAAMHAADTQPEVAVEHDAVIGKEDVASPNPAAVEEPLAQAEASVDAEPLVPREPPAREEAGSTETGVSGPADDAEWETQWSEASGSAQSASHRPAVDAATGTAATPVSDAPPVQDTVHETAQDTGYVHHPEYTDPHSPTLPGAESAAAETAAAEAARADDAVAEYTAAEARGTAPADYEPAVEPIGHLAADQPYGAGSASPGPDGGGPADFVVKGDASAMVYYEEGHADYEQTTADVWFESAAHAEAAGFRAPRRTRL